MQNRTEPKEKNGKVSPQDGTKILRPPSDTGIAGFERRVFRAAHRDDPGFGAETEGPRFELLYLENGSQSLFTVPRRGDPEQPEEAGVAPRIPYALLGGDLLVVPPGRSVSCGPAGLRRGSLYRLTIGTGTPSLLMQSAQGTDRLKKALEDAGERAVCPSPSDVSFLTDAFRMLSQPDPSSLYRGCVLLTLFVLRLGDMPDVNRSSDRGSEDTAVLPDDAPLSPANREAVIFIRNNLLSPNLNVDAVAKHMRASRSRTMTGFRREVGMPVHEFILRCKTEYARQLLLRYSVTETALLLNFSSSQHFSKVFREQTGSTPTEFVREQGGRSDPLKGS